MGGGGQNKQASSQDTDIELRNSKNIYFLNCNSCLGILPETVCILKLEGYMVTAFNPKVPEGIELIL